MNKSPTRFAVFLVVMLAAIAIVQFGLVGAPVVHLSSGAPLAGQVSQTLAATSGDELPVDGKDFKLTDTRYLLNDTWAVSQISTFGEDPNTGTVVFQKKSGIYQIVLGPGTAFPNTVVQNMPTEVSAYLSQKGVVYEPTN
jgi:hypothetical protein